MNQQIPWREMSGIRDVLMHAYNRVDSRRSRSPCGRRSAASRPLAHVFRVELTVPLRGRSYWRVRRGPNGGPSSSPSIAGRWVTRCCWN
ncbi:DUF86 domain-containing protein [Cyanobium sp. ATX 6A2]|uniref:HepT-like ribonuclease domain-containing protein n=1 Tax=Cyanobium sp. ATX 6A2 TaxID=2823700 RepID=UPI0037C1759D|nr:DUF86 domain-containing protein [Cyanobium sp. ATX 6A2]